MSVPTWMYRRGAFGRTESKLFPDESLIPDGWVDSPAKLVKKGDDLSGMDKKDLETYAKREFGVDLDRRKSVKALRAEIREMTKTRNG